MSERFCPWDGGKLVAHQTDKQALQCQTCDAVWLLAAGDTGRKK